MAEHIEAKQNRINKECKHVETESAKVAEMLESIRVRKETLRVAYEEIKKLRADLLREDESMDKNRSHVLSEQQDLCLRRATASKRLAGWTKDCQLVCGRGTRSGRIRRQHEKNPRGGRDGIHNERRQDVRRVHGWIG